MNTDSTLQRSSSTPAPESPPAFSRSPSKNSKFEKWDIRKNKKLFVIVFTIVGAVCGAIFTTQDNTIQYQECPIASLLGGLTPALVIGVCWYSLIARKKNHSASGAGDASSTDADAQKRRKIFLPSQKVQEQQRMSARSQAAGNDPTVVLRSPVATTKGVGEQPQRY